MGCPTWEPCGGPIGRGDDPNQYPLLRVVRMGGCVVVVRRKTSSQEIKEASLPRFVNLACGLGVIPRPGFRPVVSRRL